MVLRTGTVVSRRQAGIHVSPVGGKGHMCDTCRRSAKACKARKHCILPAPSLHRLCTMSALSMSIGINQQQCSEEAHLWNCQSSCTGRDEVLNTWKLRSALLSASSCPKSSAMLAVCSRASASGLAPADLLLQEPCCCKEAPRGCCKVPWGCSEGPRGRCDRA